MEWYLGALRKYAEFSGRARRKEYWLFTLFYIVGAVILTLVESVIGLAGILSGIYALAHLIPGIAVTIRRLHDTGRTGWWCLIALIPLIGAIVLLVFCVMDSEPGDNQYGSNPKA